MIDSRQGAQEDYGVGEVKMKKVEQHCGACGYTYKDCQCSGGSTDDIAEAVRRWRGGEVGMSCTCDDVDVPWHVAGCLAGLKEPWCW